MPKQRASKYYSFSSGFVQDKNVLRVVAQVDQLNDAGEPNSILRKWVRTENQWYEYDLDWYATRIWASTKPMVEVYAMGPDGRVAVGGTEGHHVETIPSNGEGPSEYGEVRDLKMIGKHLFIAGMRRQVYSRVRENEWIRRDAGVLEEPAADHVSGFNSIDGVTEDDITAVGFGGEIWRSRKGRWKQEDSPTNVILNSVKVVSKELALACGAAGTLLRRRGSDWEVLEHDATDDDFWDVEWFDRRPYFATEGALFRWTDNDTLEQVALNKKQRPTCGQLHASDGVLLSVGRKHILATTDGREWEDLDA